MRTIFNQDLTVYNSFKINAKAQKFIEFEDSADYRLLKDKPALFKEPIYILGGGNNTLFTKDFEGTILKISNKGLKVIDDTKEYRIVEVGAGEAWNDLIDYCLTNQLYGIENLIDIPGNVGSAPIQNIGAYGVEVSQVIERVNTVRISNAEEHSFSNVECEFGYRSSIFKGILKNEVIIKSVIFKFLKQGNLNMEYGDIQKVLAERKIEKPNLEDIAKAISTIRSQKLPDPHEIGNAGSFFKNPIISSNFHNELKERFPNIISYPTSNGNYKLAAGWLIENAGWKGRFLGNAGVHHQQALVLINANGKATGFEILELAKRVIEEVEHKFGVKLEAEVNII